MNRSEELSRAFTQLEEGKVLQLVEKRIHEGEDPFAVLTDLSLGMNMVGNLFEKEEYFLSELIMAAEIFNEAMKIIEPKLALQTEQRSLGRVVIGTVKGDLHDIGKNIVTTLLRCSGFEVEDLGVDVPPERFVEKLKEKRADFLGLSCLLTPAYQSMKETIQAVEKEGLREGLKILIGGGPVDERVRAYVGADAVGKDAQEAVKLCKQYLT